MDDASRVVFEPAQSDEAAPEFFSLVFSVARRKSRNSILLMIGIQRRLDLGDQNAPLDPMAKVARGAQVDVVLRGIFGRLPPADDARQVVGAQAVVPRLHFHRNLVVRLRHDLIEPRDARPIVMKRPKGQDFSHGLSKLSAVSYQPSAISGSGKSVLCRRLTAES